MGFFFVNLFFVFSIFSHLKSVFFSRKPFRLTFRRRLRFLSCCSVRWGLGVFAAVLCDSASGCNLQ